MSSEECVHRLALSEPGEDVEGKGDREERQDAATGSQMMDRVMEVNRELK